MAEENQVAPEALQDLDADISTKPATPENTVEVRNIDDLVAMMQHWHINKLVAIDSYMSMPPGSEATLDLGDGSEPVLVKLEGEALNGFKLGLVAALNEFGNLPFVTLTEEVPEDPAAPAEGTITDVG